jgi:hypothetical protein
MTKLNSNLIHGRIPQAPRYGGNMPQVIDAARDAIARDAVKAAYWRNVYALAATCAALGALLAFVV